MKTLIAVLLLCAAAFAQTPPTDALETGWNVSVNGSFSNVSNAPTNNGFATTEALRFATHWNARADQYITLAPSAVIVTAGPEYRLNLAHILKTTTYAANASKFEAFANLKLGTARSSTTDATGTATLSKASLAYGVGGGFDFLMSKNVSMRVLDISYIRSPMFAGSGGLVLGNHLAFAAGLGIRF